MKKHYKILILLLMVLGGVGFAFMQSAKATITITPMSVVIEGRDRYADVNVVNSSATENVYAIEWLYFKQFGDDGDYEELTQSATEWDLAKHIVFTPKRFSLKPRDLQKVRLGLRLNGEPPPPGDYRAHLLIKKVSAPKPSQPLAGDQPQAKVGVSIDVGFSIPVIYRSGVSDVTAVMGDINVRRNEKTSRPEIVVPIERKGGPFGLIGNIRVYNNDEVVANVPNANIFSELDKRIFVITATKELVPGTLRIVYTDTDKKDSTVFAEKSVSYGQ